MKKSIYLRLVLCLCLINLSTLDNSVAEESAWSAGVSSAFNSDYMFRGVNLYDGISIQPSTTLAYDAGELGVFSGSIWGHFSAESNRKDEGFTELDYTFTYDITYEFLSLTFGHIFYTFPEDKNDLVLATNEYFASVTVDTFLSPTFSFYQDYKAFDYQYYEINFSHKLEINNLGEGFNTTPYIAIGFASNADKIYNDDGATHVAFGTSFDMALGDITFIPSLNYTRKIDDFTVSEFWTGLTLSYDF